jgi:hypothetical protein
MMQHTIDDYIVVSQGKKNFIGKVVKEGTIKLTPPKVPEETEYLQYLPNEVIAILGDNPKIGGTVYWCKFEPHLKTMVHDGFGDIHWFFKPLKPFRDQLNQVLDKVFSIMEENKLSSVFPLNVEMRVPSGKYTGTYRYTGRDKTEYPDTMTLKPKEGDQLNYVVLHELGHAVWYRLLTHRHKIRARWIKLYHRAITVTEVGAKDVNRILQGIKSQDDGGLVSDYRGQLSEEDQLIFDACVSYVYDYHSIDLIGLDTLLAGDEDIDNLWPDTVKLSDMEVQLTEYAQKSVEEYFAEAFSLHFSGKKLPSVTSQLLEKTLQALR